MCDAITSINKPRSQRSPLPEMKNATSSKKNIKVTVVFKKTNPQSPSKESECCGLEPDDKAEANIIFSGDDKGDICDKKETKDDLTEVAANIFASKDIQSEASGAQSWPKASNKHMRPRMYQMNSSQTRPSLFGERAGGTHVVSHERESLWSHRCLSENFVEKAMDAEYQKKPLSMKSEAKEKHDLNDSHSSFSHCELGEKCDTSIGSMNPFKKSPICSSSNNESFNGESNLLDNNCDSLDHILRDSKSKTRSLVSVGEPVPIKDYALRERKSDTPTSTAMKKVTIHLVHNRFLGHMVTFTSSNFK